MYEYKTDFIYWLNTLDPTVQWKNFSMDDIENKVAALIKVSGFVNVKEIHRVIF